MVNSSNRIFKEINSKIDLSNLDLTEQEIKILDSGVGSQRDVNRLLHKIWQDVKIGYSGDEFMMNRQRATYYSLLSQKLYSKSMRNAAIAVSKSCLLIAAKYRLTSLGIEMNRVLLRWHMVGRHNLREGKRYQAEIRQLQKDLILETKAEDYYTQMVYAYNKQRQSDNLATLITMADELEQSLHLCNSPLFQYFARYLIHMKNHYLKDGVEEQLTQSIEYFQNLPFNYSIGRLAFIQLLINYYTDSSRYDEAHRLLENHLDNLDIDNHDHALILLSKLKIEINQFDLQSAKKTIGIIKKPRFSIVFDASIDIYQNYINVLDNTGRVHLKKQSFEVFRQDKTGMNLTLIILELFSNVKKKNFDPVKESKDKYISYIRNNKLQKTREAVLIQLLLLTPMLSWNSTGFYKKCSKLEGKLATYKTNGLEILEYSRLWSNVLEGLTNSKKVKNVYHV